jgi:hypothetical protein
MFWVYTFIKLCLQAKGCEMKLVGMFMKPEDEEAIHYELLRWNKWEFCSCEDQVWYIWEIQNVVGLVEHPNVVWIG